MALIASLFAGQSSSPSLGGSGKASQGRDPFYFVSVSRCHTQKKIYKGFSRKRKARA
jgi:hypothetical protein